MNSPRPFPWDAIIAFGLGVLKLPPEQFWRMTPLEIGILLGTLNPASMGPLRPGDLAALMSLYPDDPHGQPRS